MFIQINHITKAYNGRPVLQDINFGVREGKLTALLGPSGSGKTTLLRILAGLEQQDSGNLALANRPLDRVPASQRDIGFVFQNYALFEHLTVAQNIAFGLHSQHVPATEITARVDELLQLTALTAFASHYPSQLSGGQKQRVAFARAIAPHPKVLLLDEPFAALDQQIRQELRSWLRQLVHRLNITSIFVTHDQEEAVACADDIVVLHDGRIQQVGTPAAIYHHPQNQFVARFIGHTSCLTDPNLAAFQLPQALHTVFIRPEYVHVFAKNAISQIPGVFEPATVVNTTFQGANIAVELRLHGQALTAIHATLDQPLLAGQQVFVSIERLIGFTDAGSQVFTNPAYSQRLGGAAWNNK
ncbi:ABC transporter ATP-binding protein [Lacticaseibacillus sp. GG6-2]